LWSVNNATMAPPKEKYRAEPGRWGQKEEHREEVVEPGEGEHVYLLEIARKKVR